METDEPPEEPVEESSDDRPVVARDDPRGPPRTEGGISGNPLVTNGALAYLTATAVLIASGLFTWFTARYTGLGFLDETVRGPFAGERSSRGWENIIGWGLPVLLSGVISIDLVTRAGRDVVPPLEHAAAPLAVSIVAALGVAVTVIRGDDFGVHGQILGNGGALGAATSTTTAAWVALIAAVGLVVAGEWVRRERVAAATCTDDENR